MSLKLRPPLRASPEALRRASNPAASTWGFRSFVLTRVTPSLSNSNRDSDPKSWKYSLRAFSPATSNSLLPAECCLFAISQRRFASSHASLGLPVKAMNRLENFLKLGLPFSSLKSPSIASGARLYLSISPNMARKSLFAISLPEVAARHAARPPKLLML